MHAGRTHAARERQRLFVGEDLVRERGDRVGHGLRLFRRQRVAGIGNDDDGDESQAVNIMFTP